MFSANKFTSSLGSGLIALSFLFQFVGLNPLQAQTWNPGWGDQIHQQRYLQDAGYRDAFDQYETKLYRTRMDAASHETENRSDTFFIPVVFHIVHLPGDTLAGESASNPSNDQIQAGLDWLNQAFTNTGPYAGDPQYTNAGIPSASVNIQFCLARNAPGGELKQGINRLASPLSDLTFDAPSCDDFPGLTQYECLKALSNWDHHGYLNIWLVNQICRENGNCNLFGHTWGPTMHGTVEDGIVLESRFWGTSPDSQAVAIFQVGKYLGLLSTFWADFPSDVCVNTDCLGKGDRVCDTPPDADGNPVSCEDGLTVNTCSTDGDDMLALNPFIGRDVEDIYENFMDGGELGCKHSFTPQQKDLMRRVLLQDRSSLLQSDGCTFYYENLSLQSIVQPDVATCESSVRPVVRIYNSGNRMVQSCSLLFELDLANVVSYSWTGSLAAGDSLDWELPTQILTEGVHHMRLEITSVNGLEGDYILSDNVQNKSFAYFQDEEEISSFPYCVSSEDGKLPAYWKVANLDGVVSFDVYEWDDCEPATGQYVIRYNTSGSWADGLSAAPTGTRDLLISPLLDLTNYAQAQLSFNRAYKAAGPGQDLNLRIKVIEACGSGSTALYQKGRLDLESSQTVYDPSLVAWEPLNCAEWGADTINLNAFAGKKIHVVFEVEIDSAYSQNLYLDNLCFEASTDCVLPDKIPSEVGAYVADQVCTDGEGWTHYWKSAGAEPVSNEDLLLLSVKDANTSGLLLPPGEVTILLTPQRRQGGHDLSQAPYAANAQGWYVMGRCFLANPLMQANDSTLVRFYFDGEDVADMSLAGGGTLEGPEDLVVYQVDPEVNPDPALGHESISPSQYREYRPADQPSLSGWQLQELGNFYAATFAVRQLGGGGAGTGGDGFGNGALYPPAIQPFEAEQSFQDIELRWETKAEWQTETFELYRSANGIDFELYGSLRAAGTSALTSLYHFTDSLPLADSNYYCLRLVHQNGLIVHSDTILISFDPAKIVKVFPNPTPDFLRVALEVRTSQPVAFEVYDGKWQKMAQTKWIQDADELHELDIRDLSPGIYFFVVYFGRETYRGKVIKTGW